MSRHFPFATLTLALSLSASAWGQWSTDPQKNTPVANVPGAAQVQPQIAATADGHWWISWFSLIPQGSAPQGYDVFLQRLGPDGSERYPHQGLQIANLGVGWTEDYGLATDPQGNAVLTFQDDRAHPPARAIAATKIDPAGQPLWQTLTAPSGHAPHVSILPDGHSVIGWSTDTENSVRLRKLDPLGQPVWKSADGAALDFVLVEPGYSYRLADLQTTGDGSVIVSFIRNRGISGAKHLYANKISPSGQLLWGPAHVKIFDAGSLQQGNFPHFVLDGQGGAVFAWYSIDPQIQVYAQHIQANGSPAFAANGVPVSTNLQQARTSPSLTYQPSTGEITLFWTELDSALEQHRRGLYAQKFDARGARQWGETGRTVLPLARHDIAHLHSVAVTDGTLAFWVQSSAGGHDTIQAIKLDATGAARCPQFAVSTRPSAKSRLVSGASASGQTLIAWEDQAQNQGADIYLQSVSADCRLGAR
ncbi:hypothetical protein [Pantoea sp. 18069]|uniref:hypothetical protein n=1 Tax=Pantoea sp. 18069 TaxID=2681415 RepID=UPI00135A380F|nr:hypothetical protein [Pantoea sp. 18069]